MKVSITTKLIQTIIMLIVGISITSCSTYPNKFKCDDARGLGCTMLSAVDKQIDSGEIKEAYKKKKCKGSSCPSETLNEGLILKTEDKAVKYEDEQITPVSDGEHIYF